MCLTNTAILWVISLIHAYQTLGSTHSLKYPASAQIEFNYLLLGYISYVRDTPRLLQSLIQVTHWLDSLLKWLVMWKKRRNWRIMVYCTASLHRRHLISRHHSLNPDFFLSKKYFLWLVCFHNLSDKWEYSTKSISLWLIQPPLQIGEEFYYNCRKLLFDNFELLCRII